MGKVYITLLIILVSFVGHAHSADLDSNGHVTVAIGDAASGNVAAVNVDNRLLVETEGNLSVSPIAGGARINLYYRDVVTAFPTTLVTYTVPALKVVDIEAWHLSTDKALSLVELQIDGVGIDAIRFGSTTATNRIQASFGSNTPYQAVAGEVIRIQAISGQTGKEFIAGLNAAERDV